MLGDARGDVFVWNAFAKSLLRRQQLAKGPVTHLHYAPTHDVRSTQLGAAGSPARG